MGHDEFCANANRLLSVRKRAPSGLLRPLTVSAEHSSSASPDHRTSRRPVERLRIEVVSNTLQDRLVLLVIGTGDDLHEFGRRTSRRALPIRAGHDDRPGRHLWGCRWTLRFSPQRPASGTRAGDRRASPSHLGWRRASPRRITARAPECGATRAGPSLRGRRNTGAPVSGEACAWTSSESAR